MKQKRKLCNGHEKPLTETRASDTKKLNLAPWTRTNKFFVTITRLSVRSVWNKDSCLNLGHIYIYTKAKALLS